MNKKALVIDGSALIYRSFYATLNQLEYYKKQNIKPSNATKLFLMILLNLLNEQKYDYVLIALDTKQKTQRAEVFEEYKANRPKMPDDLIEQIAEINHAIDLLGIKKVAIPGIEADDIIGSFCKKAHDQCDEINVYSSDKDLLQLVDDKTRIRMFIKGISQIDEFNINNFQEKFFNLQPKQIPDYKGILGDSSDNLPGIKGIGKEGAKNLLSHFPTLESVILAAKNQDERIKKSMQTKIVEQEQQALLCKQLATIDTKVLNNYQLEAFLWSGINHQGLKKFIDDHKFNGFDQWLKKENTI